LSRTLQKGCARWVLRRHLAALPSSVPAAWGDDKLAKEDLVEWAADWDDDDVDSDFDKKLRAELAKHSSATGGGGAGAAAPATGSAPGARQ
jgi:hypothetical protein